VKGLYKTEFAILAAVAIAFGVIGNFDFADELEQEAAEKEARPARAAAVVHPDLLPQRKLTHPLRCPDLWIAHSKFSWQTPRIKCVGMRS
jgi:hypothetical protein